MSDNKSEPEEERSVEEIAEQVSGQPSPEEREEITITIPLDPVHRRADAALRRQFEGRDMSVEEAVTGQVAQQVESALYELLQRIKYQRN